MLLLRVARTQPSRLSTISVLRAHSNSSSTKATTSKFNRAAKYVAITSVVTIPSIWWLKNASDEVPNLESWPSEQLVIELGPSEEEVSRIISEEAYSFPVKKVTGVSRYYGTRLASGSPCEDRFTHGKFASPWGDGSQWMAWAVFDGHAGWQTAELLKQQLLPFVRHSLNQVKSTSKDDSVPQEVVHHAIVEGFVKLDDSIVKTAFETSQSKEPLQDKVKKLAPAYAGSCALLSLYDSLTSTLHVACTGDSRAVLAQKTDGKWEAMPLSVDQTGSNEEEVARINKEHPGEENIAKDGRVLGIMVSRGFGDGRWKWPIEFQKDMKERFNGPAPLTPKYNIQTPPYLTATPVVTTTEIDPSKPSFLIMATDGLWDSLSSQQAVDLVGQWLESRGTERIPSKPDQKSELKDFGQLGKDVSWEFQEGRTTVQDDNAAVHLVRNSLGGNNHELIASRLAFGPPFSRDLRDDITVQVVFFNHPSLDK